MLNVEKGHGLGNDYLVLNAADLPWPLTAARAAALCDRHRGVGADGVLLVDTSLRPFALRIRNPDGSEAEKSGNGLRILAAWLHAHRLVRTGEWFEVTLPRDTVRMRVDSETAGGSLDVRVEMGRASFRGDAVGFRPRAAEVLDYPLQLPGGLDARIHTVSLSNPHCVVFVDVLDRTEFLSHAPSLCMHSAFAAGTNVQFARVRSPHQIDAWIWERGTGETLASGSSACAVACAAVKRGFLQPGCIEVIMIGGSAHVDVNEQFDVRLRGPAQMVFRAELCAALQAELASLP
jgi:diaminopimelate epimerase